MLHHTFGLLAVLAPAFVFAGTLRHAADLDVHVEKRALAPGNNLPAGWQYAGCYTDSTGDRKLNGASYTDNAAMTDEACISFCSSKGFTWAGTEYSSECYCGYGLKDGTNLVDTSECNMACSGDNTEACGAGNRLSVFSNYKSGPSNKATVNGYSYQGCYSDNRNSRSLSVLASNSNTSPSMTVGVCTSACKSQGYSYAGLEYGGECWCDNSLGSSAQLQSGSASATGCSMSCNGDNTEWCGGSDRLTLYSISGGATTSVTTTTTTSATVSGPTGIPSNIVVNPSFESGGNSWTISASSAGYGDLAGSFSSDSTAHSGSGYFHVSGYTSSGTTSPRGVCIAQYLYIGQAGRYTLAFHIGAVNRQYQDPRCNGPCQSQVTVNWSASIGGTTLSGSPCYGSGCSENSVGGIKTYGPYSNTITVPQGYQILTICANYSGIRRFQDDDVYLDDVTLTGPF